MFKYLKVFVILFLFAVNAQAQSIKIYAAASLTNALTAAVESYKKQHASVEIQTVFASSSSLARQIAMGAPSDLYFSADQDWMAYLVEKGKVKSSSVLPLLHNQLVLIVPIKREQSFQANAGFNFAGSFDGHLCTGEMESVPVGKYAKQSLIKLNWLDSLKGRIVGTDNVRSALAFVERAECQVGIVYKTDALISDKVKIAGVFPADSHTPIVYPMALTVQGLANPEAVALAEYLSDSKQAQQIFEHYGFVSAK